MADCPGQIGRQIPAGWRILWLAEVASTQDVVLQRARAGEREGLVVAADRQTAGRGRRGRRWITVPGQSLAFSVLLAPRTAYATRLAAVAGAVAVADVFIALGLRCGIRWPNDVVANGRKLGGVLAEASGQGLALGIGLNVSESPDVEGAGCLADYGVRIGRWPLLVAILARLRRVWEHLQRGEPGPVVSRLAALDTLRSRDVVVETGRSSLAGTAEGVDAEGRLLVKTGNGLVALDSAEVVRVGG